MPLRLNGLYPPSKVWIEYVRQYLLHPPPSPRECAKDRKTHHIVCDQLQMSLIHVDAVYGENALHLAQDRRARHLDTVRLENGVNVIRVDLVLFQDALIGCAGKVPHPTQIGPVRGELCVLQISVSVGPLLGDESHAFTLISAALSSFTWKQSEIPGISRMMVARQARSTIPTKSSLGISGGNWRMVSNT